MPFIAQRRTDIPDGVLQVLDLRPNTSQRNLIYEPPGQTKYVNRAVTDTVATTGAGPITTSAEYKGLAAYLIDRVENSGAGGDPALTADEANDIAAALQLRVDNGQSLELSDINAAINTPAGVSGSDLDGQLGNSTGTVEDVLRILAGGEYVVPAGTQVETAGNAFDATIAGAFTTGQYRETYSTGSLAISFGEGALSELTAATFEYLGTAGAAVVVYNDDGTLYT